MHEQHKQFLPLKRKHMVEVAQFQNTPKKPLLRHFQNERTDVPFNVHYARPARVRELRVGGRRRLELLRKVALFPHTRVDSLFAGV